MTSAKISDATGRLRLRRILTRRQRLQRLAIGVGVGVLVLALAWLVGVSDVLAVRSVAVTGTKVLSVDEVTSVAAVPKGQPLVWVNAAAVAERVAGLPAVGTVSVVRAWPNAVAIEVTERRPLFAVESGIGYLVVDAAGIPFQAVLEAPKGLLVAQAPADDPRLLSDVGAVLGTLPPSLRDKVRRLKATTRDSIAIELNDGVDIIWGSAEQSALKLQVVTQLMKATKARAYDVSAPSNPTTR